ncbi:hypothetical protein BLOT_016280 [Blomia tropicalis]|nr:hypothetical protein BLOT_016280 [Blomia tropicalis]
MVLIGTYRCMRTGNELPEAQFTLQSRKPLGLHNVMLNRPKLAQHKKHNGQRFSNKVKNKENVEEMTRLSFAFGKSIDELFHLHLDSSTKDFLTHKKLLLEISKM